MKKTELNNRLFETVVKAAAEEDFWRELDSIPAEKELRLEYAPSPALKQKIWQIIKKENRRAAIQKMQKSAKRVAVIAAILISVVMGSLLSVEASRNAIFNSVLEWKSDHVDIYFRQEGTPQPESSGMYKPQYIPDGFVETETKKIGAMQRTIYKNENKESIIFEQTPLSSSKMAIDTEHSTYKEIIINGRKAYLLEAKTSDDKTHLLWQTDKFWFMLSSKADKKELIQMAESIESQEK
jgi:hypothetical protein